MDREIDETVEIDVEILAKTDMAIFVSDGDNEVWLPLSQIIDPEEFEIGQTVTIEVPEWLGISKELI